MSDEDAPCFVYMIVSDAPIVAQRGEAGSSVFKIGISDHPNARLSALRTASPFGLALKIVRRLPSRRDALWIEAKLHSILRAERMCGEWFCAPAGETASAIDQTICVYGVENLGLADGPRDQLIAYLCDAGLTPVAGEAQYQSAYGGGEIEE